MPAQQTEGKDEHTDTEHQPSQNFTQLRQLFLKRRFTILRLGDSRCDLAHLRVHPGRRNDRLAAAIGNRAAHVGHILTIAKRHILPLGNKPIHKLAHRNTLASQRGFLNLHACAFKQAAIRRNRVARL